MRRKKKRRRRRRRREKRRKRRRRVSGVHRGWSLYGRQSELMVFALCDEYR